MFLRGTVSMGINFGTRLDWRHIENDVGTGTGTGTGRAPHEFGTVAVGRGSMVDYI